MTDYAIIWPLALVTLALVLFFAWLSYDHTKRAQRTGETSNMTRDAPQRNAPPYA